MNHKIQEKGIPNDSDFRLAALEPAGYTGDLAWAMFNDSKMMRFNGQTVIGAEIGRDYGITDAAGQFPPSVRNSTGASPPQYAPYKVK